MRTIIAVIAPEAVPAKTTSRWTAALRFALAEGVESKELGTFFNQHGGIAGCAKLFHSKK